MLYLASFCALRPRDATRRMRATGLVQLRRSSSSELRRSSSSIAVALQPSTQMIVSSIIVTSLFAAPRGGTRRHLEEGRELLLPRSISSVAEAPAPSQQHQLRHSSTSRRPQCPRSPDDAERSTWAFLF